MASSARKGGARVSATTTRLGPPTPRRSPGRGVSAPASRLSYAARPQAGPAPAGSVRRGPGPSSQDITAVPSLSFNKERPPKGSVHCASVDWHPQLASHAASFSAGCRLARPESRSGGHPEGGPEVPAPARRHRVRGRASNRGVGSGRSYGKSPGRQPRRPPAAVARRHLG